MQKFWDGKIGSQSYSVVWNKHFKYQNIQIDTPEDLIALFEKDSAEALFFADWFSDSLQIEVKTSGSTGKPKTIILKKEAMVASAKATGDFFKLGKDSLVYNPLPVKYIAGKMMWVRAFVLGWNMHTEVEARSYDFTAMVPLQVYKSEEDFLNKFSKILIGGGVYDKKDLNRFNSLKTKIYGSYGMTETITHIAIREIFPLATKVYNCLPGVVVDIDDRGCLSIDAPRISDTIIHTNDTVNLIDSKSFEWLGRWDNIINSGGIKLQPEPIEEVLKTAIDTPFFVAGIPDKTLGDALVLIQEGEGMDHLLDAKEKILFESAGLSKYQIPKKIFYLPNFIRTETKKIQRRETLDLLNF